MPLADLLIAIVFYLWLLPVAPVILSHLLMHARPGTTQPSVIVAWQAIGTGLGWPFFLVMGFVKGAKA